jgi:hypothetical protein
MGHFSDSDSIIRTAGVAVSLAFGASALALDKAFEVDGMEADPSSDQNVIKLRTLVHMSDALMRMELLIQSGKCGAE